MDTLALLLYSIYSLIGQAPNYVEKFKHFVYYKTSITNQKGKEPNTLLFQEMKEIMKSSSLHLHDQHHHHQRYHHLQSPTHHQYPLEIYPIPHPRNGKVITLVISENILKY